MGKNDAFAKTLAIVGTVLVVLPIVAPFVFGFAAIGTTGGYRVDYLMPFEIYPVTIAGVVLLVGAALRARQRRMRIAIAVAVMFGGIALASVSAVLTGIADSVETLETWRYVLTSAFGAASLIAQLFLAVEGVLLTRDMFKSHELPAPPIAASGA